MAKNGFLAELTLELMKNHVGICKLYLIFHV